MRHGRFRLLPFRSPLLGEYTTASQWKSQIQNYKSQINLKFKCSKFKIVLDFEFSALNLFGIWSLEFGASIAKQWPYFLFLRLLRCFTSAGTPSPSLKLGRIACFKGRPRYRIRTSPDQRLLDASPGLIAVTPRPSSALCVRASIISP